MYGSGSVAGRVGSYALSLSSVVGAAAVWAIPVLHSPRPPASGRAVATLERAAPGSYTYLLSVTNTSASAIDGVLVFAPEAPTRMSRPEDVAIGFRAGHGGARWEIRGPASRYLQPGETAPGDRPDLRFTLTYDHPVDISQLRYGLHVVGQEPGGGRYSQASAAVCGRVRCADAPEMRGIAGASVELLDTRHHGHVIDSATADAAGNYTLVPPRPGVYEVRASAGARFIPSYSARFFQPADSNASLDVILHRVPSPAALPAELPVGGLSSGMQRARKARRIFTVLLPAPGVPPLPPAV